jgi:hypothetical protein
MKIAATDLALQSSYSSSRSLQESASLHISKASSTGTSAALGSTVIKLSDAAMASLADSGSNPVSALSDAIDKANADPFLLMVRQMVELLTGRKITLLSLQDLQASAQTSASETVSATQTTQANSGGAGLTYSYHQTLTETQQATFSAEGKVRTADGQEISFKLDLSMSSSWKQETDVSLQAGAAQRKDPLVLNFAGNAAQLTDRLFSFDLLGDGNKKLIASLGSNSAYLAFDHNGNGKIDSGKELFGPSTGSGFAELAKLDSDHNGWIDENDPAYAQLRLWNPATSGDQLVSLQDRHVGAISLTNRATPFDLRSPNDTAHNNELGAVKASGIYLGNNGKAGSIQEIDLRV